MDMIQFAKLVSFVSVRGNTGAPLDTWEIESLRDTCAALFAPAPAPAIEPLPHGAVKLLVQTLMISLRHGRKIEAIKAYRTLTGDGLKDSKDAVESVTDLIRSPAYDDD